MQTKVIACDPRVKIFSGVKVDMYVECKGLLATIYHHAVLYDQYMADRNEPESVIHLDSINILGRIFNATVEENFDLHDKLSLIGQAGALCLRMVQEAKDDRIKGMCRKLLSMYNRTMIRLINKK